MHGLRSILPLSRHVSGIKILLLFYLYSCKFESISGEIIENCCSMISKSFINIETYHQYFLDAAKTSIVDISAVLVHTEYRVVLCVLQSKTINAAMSLLDSCVQSQIFVAMVKFVVQVIHIAANQTLVAIKDSNAVMTNAAYQDTIAVGQEVAIAALMVLTASLMDLAVHMGKHVLM